MFVERGDRQRIPVASAERYVGVDATVKGQESCKQPLLGLQSEEKRIQLIGRLQVADRKLRGSRSARMLITTL